MEEGRLSTREEKDLEIERPSEFANLHRGGLNWAQMIFYYVRRFEFFVHRSSFFEPTPDRYLSLSFALSFCCCFLMRRAMAGRHAADLFSFLRKKKIPCCTGAGLGCAGRPFFQPHSCTGLGWDRVLVFKLDPLGGSSHELAHVVVVFFFRWGGRSVQWATDGTCKRMIG